MSPFCNRECEFGPGYEQHGSWEGRSRLRGADRPVSVSGVSRAIKKQCLYLTSNSSPASKNLVISTNRLLSSSSARNVSIKLLWAFCGEWNHLGKREPVISPSHRGLQTQQEAFQIPFRHRSATCNTSWCNWLVYPANSVTPRNSIWRRQESQTLGHCDTASPSVTKVCVLTAFFSSRAVEQGSARRILMFYS